MNEVLDTPTTQSDRLPGVKYDEIGKPVGKSIVEIFDVLDREFIAFYGEYGRMLVNTHREEWNRQGTWHFDLL